MVSTELVLKAPKARRKPKAMDKAYIAGLIDAKSTVTITPETRGQVWRKLKTRIVLYNHNPHVLKMVQERYGGTLISSYRDKRNPPFFKLEIQVKKKIIFLIEDILPYIIAKKQVAELLLEYCQSRLKALESAESNFQAQITEEEKRIARELIKLNRNSTEDRMIRCA